MRLGTKEVQVAHIEDIYLIQKRTCILIERRTWRRETGDSDIFSGMLDAVTSFIDDSMRNESGEGLIRLERGKYLILMHQGMHASLAIILTRAGGAVDERQIGRLSSVIEKTLRDIEVRHGHAIATWNGNVGELKTTRRDLDLFAVGIDDVLEDAERRIGDDERKTFGETSAVPWAVTRSRAETATMLHRLGRREEAALWLDGLDVPPETPPYEKSRLLFVIGQAHEALNDHDRARHNYEGCARVQASNSMPLGYLGLGRLEWRRGHYRKALDLLREAHLTAVSAGELECQVYAMISEGSALARIYEEVELKKQPELLEEAISVTKTALRIAGGVGLTRPRALALMNLADYNRLIGRLDLSLAPAQEALRDFQALGEPAMIANARALIARVALSRGMKDVASNHAHELLSIPESTLPADNLVRLNCIAADILMAAGKEEESRSALRKALRVAEMNYLVTFAEQIKVELEEGAR